jgi:hypothetical protein
VPPVVPVLPAVPVLGLPPVGNALVPAVGSELVPACPASVPLPPVPTLPPVGVFDPSSGVCAVAQAISANAKNPDPETPTLRTALTMMRILAAVCVL